MTESGKYLYGAIGGFAAGVFARSFFHMGWGFVGFFFLLGALLILLGRIARSRPSHGMALMGIVLCLFALGVARTHGVETTAGNEVLEAHVGQNVVLTGIIAEEPSQKEKNQHLVVRTEGLIEGSATTSVQARVLVSAERYPRFAYGDRVTLSGVVKKPASFETDNGRTFDYVHYLAKDAIFYTMVYPSVERVATGEGNPLRAGLFAIRHIFLGGLQSVLPEPENALLAGITIGADDALGDALNTQFRTAGIVHIVVLSGYNITIVADWLMKLVAFFLPFALSLATGALGIIAFALLAGTSATVVRASIMSLLALLARATGRTYVVGRALWIAGGAMLLYNPLLLVFDPSFQLSFLATIGLIYGSPMVAMYMRRVTVRYGLRELLSATIATQIFVLPLILYRGGVFPLYAIPVNLLVLPIVPPLMGIGMLVGALGALHPLLGIPLALVAYALLRFILIVVELFTALPFAGIALPPFSFFILAALYAVIISFLVRFYTKKTALIS